MNWTEFRSTIPARLLLPVANYSSVYRFAEFEPIGHELEALQQFVRNAAVEAIEASEDPALRLLEISKTKKNILLQIHYGHETEDFTITLRRDSLTIEKNKVSVEELFITVPLLERLAEKLFGQGRYSLNQFSFFKPYSTEHLYQQQVTLGPRLSDETKYVTNTDLMSQFFVRTDESSLYGHLQPEKPTGIESTMHLDKVIAGRDSNIVVHAEAPWSQTRRNLNFTIGLARGLRPRQQPVTEDDLNEYSVILEKFYRDIVLDRIYRNVFNDLEIQPGL